MVEVYAWVASGRALKINEIIPVESVNTISAAYPKESCMILQHAMHIMIGQALLYRKLFKGKSIILAM
jgi:hypothetical protein